jgi:predicted tellurium resistance membrane protein TerC
MTEFLTTESLIALLTLTLLEIVLGIDNIVFISILTGKLDPRQQPRARQLGLGAALVSRILLLLALSWVMRLTQPLFSLFEHGFSERDLILIVGGLFLLAKGTFEIHDKLEGADHGQAKVKRRSFHSVIFQIMLIDIVFSLDSVITAVGMARHIAIMITAVVISMLIMLAFAGVIARFIERHPTMKMLALAFLLLIGVVLVAEGFGKHIEKGYIYFAMAFSLFVEMLNLRLRKKRDPVHLHQSYVDASGAPAAPAPVARSVGSAEGAP